jgi:DNA adenine methylase
LSSGSRCTSAGTLFYLDPPYWGWEEDYGAGVVTRADFVGLALYLAKISGKFILSVNDVPETREIFRRFAIESVETRYTISGRWSDVTEVMVTGPSAEPHDA